MTFSMENNLPADSRAINVLTWAFLIGITYSEKQDFKHPGPKLFCVDNLYPDIPKAAFEIAMQNEQKNLMQLLSCCHTAVSKVTSGDKYIV